MAGMTDDLFRQDAYLRECSAHITAVTDAGIVLDRTVFYPLGGGQAGDSDLAIRVAFLAGEEEDRVALFTVADERADDHGPTERHPQREEPALTPDRVGRGAVVGPTE